MDRGQRFTDSHWSRPTLEYMSLLPSQVTKAPRRMGCCWTSVGVDGQGAQLLEASALLQAGNSLTCSWNLTSSFASLDPTTHPFLRLLGSFPSKSCSQSGWAASSPAELLGACSSSSGHHWKEPQGAAGARCCGYETTWQLPSSCAPWTLPSLEPPPHC